ncbi:hypothetical protein [Flavobacterium ajazii]|uniref:hypothetical protein n=1 Tax=Flavobacterium ajazii TaxID=2692318 RepID=UPI0013D0BEFD|nr:hypothetical protein [Flavobacterium ajazii]
MEFLKSTSRVPIIVDENLKQKILEWEQKSIFYGAFPVVGDSMTCDDQNKTIPNGAKVLAYQLQIEFESGFYPWFEIPTGEPLLIMGTTSKGNDFCLCKTIFFLDSVNNMVSLRSYNPNYSDQIIPISYIKTLFKIELVIK